MRRLINAVFHPEVIEKPVRYDKTFDFVGTGKKNKGNTYRSYANDLEHAINDIVTGHRVHPNDIKLVKVF